MQLVPLWVEIDNASIRRVCFTDSELRSVNILSGEKFVEFVLTENIECHGVSKRKDSISLVTKSNHVSELGSVKTVFAHYAVPNVDGNGLTEISGWKYNDNQSVIVKIPLKEEEFNKSVASREAVYNNVEVTYKDGKAYIRVDMSLFI